MLVGYSPDAFGNLASLPMILQGFNIDNVLFNRGRPKTTPPPPRDFLWQAPDGSTVLALEHNYTDALFLPYPNNPSTSTASPSRVPFPHLTRPHFYRKLSLLVSNSSEGIDHAGPRQASITRRSAQSHS